MLTYPVIDPVAVALGPVKVHWYGLMYLLGFAAAWWLAVRRSQQPWAPVRREQVDDLIVYAALGVVVGGRLGSGLFYNFDIWSADPLWIFRIWEGGMAFHGGLLGVLTALWLYGRKLQQPFLAVADFVAPLVPIGLGLGRIGNFIGQELWGRATNVPWAMVFPRDPEQLARHPSQLYQASLEGAVLFAVLFWFSRRERPTGAVGGLFLALYGLFRFLVEFVREPDRNIGFDLLGWLTRGQLLSLPMILAGLLLIGWAYGSARQRTQH
ncbi:MAG: prolipoprotein diacylglyceryl transferase [Gammaproteobacteria bacterium]|nr:prolipoprotein diacylglyceryl transferase [Gammaproteobacteria bacterium]